MPVSKVKSQKSQPKAGGPLAQKVVKAASKASKSSKLSLPIYGLSGKKKGNVELPKEIFGAKVNEKLMAQAIRVYLVNQRQGTASTKTRGEVNKTTAKWYRQKGTGRARHGAKSAPIFVGGGIAFGPRPRRFDIKLSKQMKKKALASALTQKFLDQKVLVVDSKNSSGKTSEFAKLFKNLNLLTNKEKDNLVLYISDLNIEAKRAVRNISGVTIRNAESLNTYEVLANKNLIFSSDAISNLSSHFLKKE